MVGSDVHDDSMALRIGVDDGRPERRTVRNSRAGRQALAADLKQRAAREGAQRVVITYEASGQGFILYDEMTAAGFECHVVAPTRMASSPHARKRKTDDADALRLFEATRAHVLAGNALPDVWVPDPTTRDDREVVRARQDVQEKRTAVKTQVQSLLKRNGVETPARLGTRWSQKYRAWLRGLTTGPGPLGPGARVALKTLYNQLLYLEAELEDLDAAVAALSSTARYAAAVRAMCAEKGVGLTTAMVYLTELGDLRRFTGRRKVGSYLGLTPSSRESGAASDRKGHITHQGPGRVRKVLCQAVWARLRYDAGTRARHERISGGRPQRRKVATVALMRQLAVRLWRLGLDAPTAESSGPSGPSARPAAAGG
jgi:transposase